MSFASNALSIPGLTVCSASPVAAYDAHSMPVPSCEPLDETDKTAPLCPFGPPAAGVQVGVVGKLVIGRREVTRHPQRRTAWRELESALGAIGRVRRIPGVAHRAVARHYIQVARGICRHASAALPHSARVAV